MASGSQLSVGSRVATTPSFRCSSLHLRSEELFQKLFGIHLHRGSAYLPPSSIYLLNNFFISLWTRGYLYFGYIYFIYFVSQIAPALATGSSFGWFLRPFDMPPLIWVCFVFKYFLVLQNAPDRSCIFSASALESAISPRTLVLLIGKWPLDTKIWLPGVLAVPGVSLLLVLLRR